MRIRAVKYFVCRRSKPAAATTELVCTNEFAYQLSDAYNPTTVLRKAVGVGRNYDAY